MEEKRGSRKADKTLSNGTVQGFAFAVLFAANVLGFVVFSVSPDLPIPTMIMIWYVAIVGTALFSGPGALVLALVFVRLIRRIADRVPDRPRLLLAGMAVGVVPGAVNVLLAAFLADQIMPLVESLDDQVLLLLPPALAGGVGLGLGCALAVPVKSPVAGDAEP